jgi:hypothetical protein
MLWYAQIAALVVITAYLCQRQIYLSRRNQHTSASLIANMRRSPVDAESLWSRLQDARMVMEMVDFAESHGDSTKFDPTQLIALRRDAMEYRLELVAEMARRAMPIGAR